jgi:prolyl 4-hydroxylase
LDAFSMHAGCPVIKGVKWSATSWIHTQPFDPNAALGVRVPQDQKEEQASGALQKADAAADAAAGGGRCVDLDARCAEWAGKGECERNAAFMTGSEAFAGRCRRACKACCPAGDVLCMRALEGRRRAAQQ